MIDGKLRRNERALCEQLYAIQFSQYKACWDRCKEDRTSISNLSGTNKADPFIILR